jgi:multidrug efflux pump subunit AcrA (membrane-fusion protein)
MARDIAKLKIEIIKSKILSFEKQIEQFKANIKGLKEKLSRYTIISPVDGYIVKKSIANFQIISPNQTIIEIVNPKDIWVETYIDTRMSGDVKIGDKAMIKLRSSHEKVAGKVVNIKPINNSVTNEREVDIAFDNLKIPFYIAEQASVAISTAKLHDIIRIPSKTLVIYKEKTGVWILDEANKAQFMPLEILAYQRKDAAVKSFDIKHKILIPNPKKKPLSNGMKIIND